MESAVGVLLLSLLIVIGLFMIFRAIALWYWRINEQIRVLSEIRDELHNYRVEFVAATRAQIEATKAAAPLERPLV